MGCFLWSLTGISVRLQNQEHPFFTDGQRQRDRVWPEATHSGADRYELEANPAHSCSTSIKGLPPHLLPGDGGAKWPPVVCFLWLCCAYLVWLKDVCRDNQHHKGWPHTEAGEGASM